MKKKERWTTVILILIFLTGLSLLLYPTFSDYWNSLHQTKAIANYAKQVSQLDEETYEELLADAREYNKKLLKKQNRFVLSEEEQKEYESLLDVSGNGIIGYIEIPQINCSLPIYHGTEESVLQIAIGHIAGSSLPVGGKGTHCVLSGHRGLPSAKLFTNLDKLAEGDTFMLRVLNETLTYEVDQILIVLPDQVDALEIEEGHDYCTLVTCTPYGINTHRLLVRGHRVPNTPESRAARITSEAIQVKPALVAVMLAVPVLAVLIVIVAVKTRKR